jgi:hypothetical protein
MTYNDKIMEDLKHAIQVWRMNYLIEKGIDPQPHISNLVGKIDITIDPVQVNDYITGEEE